MVFVCRPKFLLKHCFQFLLGVKLKWPQEKLKTMLMQNSRARGKADVLVQTQIAN